MSGPDPEKIFRLLVAAARTSADEFTVRPWYKEGNLFGFVVSGELTAVTKALRYRKNVTKTWLTADSLKEAP